MNVICFKKKQEANVCSGNDIYGAEWQLHVNVFCFKKKKKKKLIFAMAVIFKVLNGSYT